MLHALPRPPLASSTGACPHAQCVAPRFLPPLVMATHACLPAPKTSPALVGPPLALATRCKTLTKHGNRVASQAASDVDAAVAALTSVLGWLDCIAAWNGRGAPWRAVCCATGCVACGFWLSASRLRSANHRSCSAPQTSTTLTVHLRTSTWRERCVDAWLRRGGAHAARRRRRSTGHPLTRRVQVVTQASINQGGAVWLRQTYRISSAWACAAAMVGPMTYAARVLHAPALHPCCSIRGHVWL